MHGRGAHTACPRGNLQETPFGLEHAATLDTERQEIGRACVQTAAGEHSTCASRHGARELVRSFGALIDHAWTASIALCRQIPHHIPPIVEKRWVWQCDPQLAEAPRCSNAKEKIRAIAVVLNVIGR